MPSFSTTIEDNSPLLVYSAGWAPGLGSSDPLVSNYSSSNFMATQVSGATLTFSFNGTGVQLFGAKRDNHGFYVVTVDGNSFPPVSGEGDNEFQQLLFSASNLNDGPHELVLTNQEAKFVDIDFVTWQSNIGNDNEVLLSTVVKDSDPAFSYSGGWSTSPDNVGTFLGGSGHQTSTSDVSFVYTFQGDGVSLYGPVGQNFAPYSVQIDGGSTSSFTASSVAFDSQVLLYRATGLGRGQHSLRFNSQATQDGQNLAIDYAVVFSTSSLGGVSSGSLSSTAGANRTTGLSAAAGAGIAIVCMMGFLLAVVGALLLWRLRQRQWRRESTPRPFEKLEAGFSVSEPDMIGPDLRRQSQSSFGDRLPSSNVSDNASVQGVARSESFQSAVSQTRLLRMERDSYVGTPSNASINSVSTNSTSPRINVVQYSLKGRQLFLPAAMSQSQDEGLQVEPGAPPIMIKGRPQNSDLQTNRISEANPPPDYTQATGAP